MNVCDGEVEHLPWFEDKTPEANSTPGVERWSSSSVELEFSDSDIFITFFQSGLDWLATFLGSGFVAMVRLPYGLHDPVCMVVVLLSNCWYIQLQT